LRAAETKAALIASELTINPDDLLLDVGCGDGKALAAFDCKKIGIDPSIALLKQADIPVVQGIAEKLPFPDNTFDIVVSLTAIHHCDVDRALDEMKRVAKRDIIVSVLKTSEKAPSIEKTVTESLNVVKRLEERYDIIFLCSKL